MDDETFVVAQFVLFKFTWTHANSFDIELRLTSLATLSALPPQCGGIVPLHLPGRPDGAHTAGVSGCWVELQTPGCTEELLTD